MRRRIRQESLLNRLVRLARPTWLHDPKDLQLSDKSCFSNLVGVETSGFAMHLVSLTNCCATSRTVRATTGN